MRRRQSRSHRRRHPVARPHGGCLRRGVVRLGGIQRAAQDAHLLGSNQGANLEVDKKVLQPELDKFEKETGIKVKL